MPQHHRIVNDSALLTANTCKYYCSRMSATIYHPVWAPRSRGPFDKLNLLMHCSHLVSSCRKCLPLA